MTEEKRGVSGTKEWSTDSVNVVKGCSHGCLYCYARVQGQRWGYIDEGLKDWLTMRVTRKNRGQERKKYDGVVMFPSTHDITPEVIQPCVEALMNLLIAGNDVLIVSKPHLSVIDVLTRVLAPWLDQILFRFTIGALDGDIVKHWEPFAPPPAERLACLQMARSRGFQTSVSMEPMLDVKNIKRDVGIIARWVTQSIWLGKMNKMRQRVVVYDGDREGLVYCGVSPKEIDRVEEWQSDKRIKELHRHFTEHPVMNNPTMVRDPNPPPGMLMPPGGMLKRPEPTDAIKYKESIKLVVGIALETEAGTDR